MKPAYREQMRMIDGSRGHSFSYHAADGERLVNIARVPGLDWYLASEIGTREFDAGLRATIMTTVAISLVLIVIGSMLGIVFARSISERVDNLRESIVQLGSLINRQYGNRTLPPPAGRKNGNGGKARLQLPYKP